MQNELFDRGARIAFGLMIFAALATAILLQSPKKLRDFDQSFYLTIAYDLTHHGVFSNGVFDKVNSTVAAPPPGMFFGPVYPWLIVAATKVDPRFARAVDCSVEANQNTRDETECEIYALPMHLMHAALLALGVIAAALAAEAIFASSAVFWLAGVLATLALLPDADLFAFVMSESVTFALYSFAALALVLALRKPGPWRWLAAGGLFGLICLTRPSFLVATAVAAIVIAIGERWLLRVSWRAIAAHACVFAIGWLLVVGPWAARNAVSVGKWGLTEEYGSAALIERFAYDDMTAREFALAFPYCLPEIGQPLVDWAFGPETMARFVYYSPRSFFHVGRAHRDKLVERHGRLDPLIGDVIRAELRERWWRYLLTSVPIGWCGVWVGGLLGLALVPLFVCAAVVALRRSQPLFLLYAAPALAMLALHAALANESTRYNLILIGPFSAGAAWMIVQLATWVRRRRAEARSRTA